MAVLPLNKTISDVDQAATLINQGTYYGANAVLKTAQDAVRFDVIDAVAVPQKAGPANATSSQTTGSPAAGKASR